MIIPVFDPTEFKEKYPQYIDISDDTLNLYWNTGYPLAMPIIGLLKPALQSSYWDLVVAHLAEIAATGQTGRINGASEGSVSGSSEFNSPKDAEWWNMTPYGQQIWQIMITYKNMKGGATYIPFYNCANRFWRW